MVCKTVKCKLIVVAKENYKNKYLCFENKDIVFTGKILVIRSPIYYFIYYVVIYLTNVQGPTTHDRQVAVDADHHEHEHNHGSSEGLDSAVGVSLVLGFIFMLLIDQVKTLKTQFCKSVPK